MIAPAAEVREQHRFDVAALERYLSEHVAGFRGPLEVRQFRGGQSNPTYHLAAGGRDYVLRRKPPGKLLPSAHAVDREYRVITALGLSFAKMVMGRWPTLHHENRLPCPRAGAQTRRRCLVAQVRAKIDVGASGTPHCCLRARRAKS
jgi:hypothetical protein